MSVTTTNQEKTINSKYLDECIFAMAKNDLSYMNELYNYTHVKVYSYVLSILKNKHDAEDITHDTYVTVYPCLYWYTKLLAYLAGKDVLKYIIHG